MQDYEQDFERFPQATRALIMIRLQPRTTPYGTSIKLTYS